MCKHTGSFASFDLSHIGHQRLAMYAAKSSFCCAVSEVWKRFIAETLANADVIPATVLAFFTFMLLLAGSAP